MIDRLHQYVGLLSPFHHKIQQMKVQLWSQMFYDKHIFFIPKKKETRVTYLYLAHVNPSFKKTQKKPSWFYMILHLNFKYTYMPKNVYLVISRKDWSCIEWFMELWLNGSFISKLLWCASSLSGFLKNIVKLYTNATLDSRFFESQLLVNQP
jgi:hypothetical protein